MAKKSLQIIVKGKVQGVWFRKSTQQKAIELGLFGYVCNQPDGSVYIEVEGPENQVNKLIEWLHIGPELAQVFKVEVKIISPKDFNRFEIN